MRRNGELQRFADAMPLFVNSKNPVMPIIGKSRKWSMFPKADDLNE